MEDEMAVVGKARHARILVLEAHHSDLLGKYAGYLAASIDFPEGACSGKLSALVQQLDAVEAEIQRLIRGN